MTSSTTTRPEVTRSADVDRVRGLAVLCMIADHVVSVLGGPLLVRYTIGRVAVPLFFVTAGRVGTRLRWRHAAVGAAGLGLPYAAGWIDSPNVLVWWALGAVALWCCRACGISPAWLTVAALTAAVNGWTLTGSGFYDPLVLWGLMGLGSVLPWSWWAFGDRLPAFCGWLGRHALGVYVGHVLVLTGLAVLLL